MSAADWTAIGVAGVGAVTGIVGAVTGIMSLKRQDSFEKRSGHIVVVTAQFGVAGLNDGPHGVIAVEASNQGRSAVQATGWGVLLPDGRQMVFLQPMFGSDPVPTTLEGGHKATWRADLRNAQQLVVMNDAGDLDLIPFVHLGTGLTVRGKPLEAGRGAIRALL